MVQETNKPLQNTMGKEKARQQVVELEALPFMNAGNSASHFVNSIDWHPRWVTIFRTIKRVREEYDSLIQLKPQIEEAVMAGGVETISDWGGGWSWSADIVRVDGRRIRIFESGACCLYRGQHDRPVLNLFE